MFAGPVKNTFRQPLILNFKYRNRSNFHGTNISRIHKLDIIRDFIFTNPDQYKAI